jgi:hypothetical protein
MSLGGYRDHLPPYAGAVAAATPLNIVEKELPSSQEKHGDDELDQLEVHEMINKLESMAAENNRRTMEDMQIGLYAESGISNFLHAQDYRRAARDAFGHAQVTFT